MSSGMTPREALAKVLHSYGSQPDSPDAFEQATFRVNQRDFESRESEAILVALAAAGWTLTGSGKLDALREALEQAYDRMNSAFDAIRPSMFPDETIAQTLWFGMEEISAVLSPRAGTPSSEDI